MHWYGGDLFASPSGDLQLADTPTTGTQRVYRRLLTNPALSDASGKSIASADYIWHPGYGAGVPRKVGSPGNAPAMRALIKSQMFLERAVARRPLPTISLNQINDLVSVTITYVDANTAILKTVSFDVGQEA